MRRLMTLVPCSCSPEREESTYYRVLKAANEMLDHLSSVDWLYENGFGQVYSCISARKILEWCNVLGGEPPEGTEEHAKNG